MWKKTGESDSPTQNPSRETAGSTTAQRSQPPKPSGQKLDSIFSPALTIRGDISGTEDLSVQGAVEGTINLPENELYIGANGRVRADLFARRIVIEGQVKGDLRANQQVVIKNTGRVEGNITSPGVVLEDGCQFKGSVQMDPDAHRETKPAASSQPAKPKNSAAAPKPVGNSQGNDKAFADIKSRASTTS